MASLARTGVKVGMKRVRPVGMNVRRATKAAERATGVSVIDAGDRVLTGEVSEALGLPVRTPVHDDLIIAALGVDNSLASVADRLAEQRRRGGDVLLVVVGDAAVRRRHVADVRAAADLDVGCVFVLERLDEDGREQLRDAVIRRLGDRAVNVARDSAPLARTADEGLLHRQARRAAIVAALPGSAATMPVISALQVRMAADISQLAGPQPQGLQAAQAAGIAVCAPVLRQVARVSTAILPGLAPALRAGIAYGATAGIGRMAQRLRRDTSHSEPSEEER